MCALSTCVYILCYILFTYINQETGFALSISAYNWTFFTRSIILYMYIVLLLRSTHQEINLGKSLKITSLIRIYQSPTYLHGIKPPFLVIDYKGKTIKSRKICNFLTSSWGQTSFFQRASWDRIYPDYGCLILL